MKIWFALTATAAMFLHIHSQHLYHFHHGLTLTATAARFLYIQSLHLHDQHQHHHHHHQHHHYHEKRTLLILRASAECFHSYDHPPPWLGVPFPVFFDITLTLPGLVALLPRSLPALVFEILRCLFSSLAERPWSQSSSFFVMRMRMLKMMIMTYDADADIHRKRPHLKEKSEHEFSQRQPNIQSVR